MSREVRRVPADWQHPKEYNVHRGKECFRGMYGRSHAAAFAAWRTRELPEWLAAYDQWQNGLVYSYAKKQFVPIDWDEMWDSDRSKAIVTYEDYAGVCPSSPDPENYMPEWTEAERTHLMMYETTSEGTPISPAFATPEELAHWLADNGASSFGSCTATYDDWLVVCQGGYAPSAVMTDGELISGVEFAGRSA